MSLSYLRSAYVVLIASLFISGCEAGKSSSAPYWLEKDSFAATSSSDGNIKVLLHDTDQGTSMVYRSETSDANFEYIGSTSAQTYVDSGAEQGKTYYYKVYHTQSTSHPDLNSSAAQTASLVIGVRDPCFDKSKIRALKSASNVPDLTMSVIDYYDECSTALALKVGQPLSTNELKFVVAAFLSHSMAGYGRSTTDDLMELLAEDQLDCDNYMFLAGHIFELLAGSEYTEQLTYIGFNHGAVGNHAQLLYESSTRSIIVDATVGFVAFTSYDNLIHGVPLSDDNIASFYNYWDDPNQPNGLHRYFWRVRTALIKGLYRPQDFLYYYGRPKGV